MKTFELKQMEKLEGGSNRQCFIDGVLTLGATVLGGIVGGAAGAAAGLFGGFFAANANGCFEN